MTTTSLIVDNRFSASGDCGVGTFGLYFEKRADGGNTPNDRTHENSYNLFILATNVPQVSYKVNSTGLYRHGCSVPGFSFGLQTFDSNDVLSLTNKLASNIKGHSFNAAVSLGEGGKTLSMIGDRARQLYGALKSVKRGDLPSAARYLGVSNQSSKRKLPRSSSNKVQQNWLELEFGWRPLINDLYEGSQAVFSLTNRPLYRTFKSTIYKKKKEFNSDGIYLGTNDALLTYRTHLKEDYSPIASLGLEDPSLVAWELLPYSFVADWVVPFGNYLEARAFLSHLGSSIWSTYFSKVQLKSNYIGTPFGLADSYRTYKRVDLVRAAVSPSLPLPTIKPFGKIASWRHAVDSLALLMQLKK